jgi:hypothetical protein
VSANTPDSLGCLHWTPSTRRTLVRVPSFKRPRETTTICLGNPNTCFPSGKLALALIGPGGGHGENPGPCAETGWRAAHGCGNRHRRRSGPHTTSASLSHRLANQSKLCFLSASDQGRCAGRPTFISSISSLQRSTSRQCSFPPLVEMKDQITHWPSIHSSSGILISSVWVAKEPGRVYN